MDTNDPAQLIEENDKRVLTAIDRKMSGIRAGREFAAVTDEQGCFFQYSVCGDTQRPAARLYLGEQPWKFLVIQRSNQMHTIAEEIKKDLGDKVAIEYWKGTGTCK